MEFITKGLAETTVSDDLLQLPPHLAEIAERDYGETVETRTKILTEFRSKIIALPDQDRLDDTSDINLIRFLRNRKFNVDRAVDNTIAYTKFHRENPELFDITPEEILLFEHAFQVVQGGAPDYRIVFIVQPIRLIKQCTEEFARAHPFLLLRFNCWFLERISRLREAQVSGLMAVITFSGLTFWDNVALGRFVKLEERIKAFTFATSCLGMKIKGLFMFNEPMLIKAIFTVIMTFLSSKLRSRFFLGGTDYRILQTHFQGQLHTLPEALGGTSPNDRISPWLVDEVKLWQKQHQQQEKEKKVDGKGEKDNDISPDKLPVTNKLP